MVLIDIIFNVRKQEHTFVFVTQVIANVEKCHVIIGVPTA